MIPTVEAFAHETQCGGLCGRGTDIAALLVRLHFDHACAMGMSASAVFLDVVAAFYELVREVVLDLQEMTLFAHCALG